MNQNIYKNTLQKYADFINQKKYMNMRCFQINGITQKETHMKK